MTDANKLKEFWDSIGIAYKFTINANSEINNQNQ